jgi:hypothetical protein
MRFELLKTLGRLVCVKGHHAALNQQPFPATQRFPVAALKRLVTLQAAGKPSLEECTAPGAILIERRRWREQYRIDPPIARHQTELPRTSWYRTVDTDVSIRQAAHVRIAIHVGTRIETGGCTSKRRIRQRAATDRPTIAPRAAVHDADRSIDLSLITSSRKADA